MESFGKYIKSERERKGISIEEISRVTKISPGQIKSLENDDFAALPPMAFVKGFTRAYSKHLGIDPDETILRLEQFLSEIEGEEDSFGEKASRQFRRSAPNPKILIAVAAAALFLFILLIVLAVRGCGKPETAFNPAPTQVSATVASQREALDALRLFEQSGETAQAVLPVVPPQSYRVLKRAVPRNAVVKASDASGELPGGGTGTQSP